MVMPHSTYIKLNQTKAESYMTMEDYIEKMSVEINRNHDEFYYISQTGDLVSGQRYIDTMLDNYNTNHNKYDIS